MTVQNDDSDSIGEDQALIRRLVGRFQETLESGQPADECERRLAALLAHLDASLGFEEGLMLERGYPLAFTHAREHKCVQDQVAVVLDGLKSGAVTPANLGKVLLHVHDHDHHIRNHDMLFRADLQDKYCLQAVEDGGGI